jgi:hypothetical protein
VESTRLSWVLAPSVKMEEAERWLKHQHRVYCSGRSSVEGDPIKRAGAHSCLQTWSRHRGVVWRASPTGWENSSREESTIARGS